ncbi:CYFA0S30e00298g1_1 [Cyberlindnera fabianii]|uniref:CYFA0S30e00298g1_1 n=1 Tax=Cyberlindnera fabianii TaxID=36022 RepID=A0A061BB80_CYBFA|nr:Quinate dehydrogenase [Cyberlindnera fabianii]CDR47201.1 CYFA0S30e00298g1_1 [Cyberlindnera fabianii]
MTKDALLKPDYESLRETPQTFYLFGEHISHSRAPHLHNTLFNLVNLPWEYKLFESSNFVEINDVFDRESLIGSAITMPNKVVALNHVDVLDPIGHGCGSINTVYTMLSPDGTRQRVGTNTDTVGIFEAIRQNYPEEADRFKGTPGLVYGAGGACRSAVYALYKLLGVSKVYIINRIAEEVRAVQESMRSHGFTGEIIHVTDPEMAQKLESPKLVVLTVPDFEPTSPGEKLARATLSVFEKQEQDEPGVVLEMCYHPRIETRLYNSFVASGWKVISGVEAMIYQGIAQQVLWTGIPLEQLPVKKVIEIIYKSIEDSK